MSGPFLFLRELIFELSPDCHFKVIWPKFCTNKPEYKQTSHIGTNSYGGGLACKRRGKSGENDEKNLFGNSGFGFGS